MENNKTLNINEVEVDAENIFSDDLQDTIQKFGALKRSIKNCSPEKRVRKMEEAKGLLQHNMLELLKLDPSKNKYITFYLQICFGETILNKFGKKLYFELANETRVNYLRPIGIEKIEEGKIKFAELQAKVEAEVNGQ